MKIVKKLEISFIQNPPASGPQPKIPIIGSRFLLRLPPGKSWICLWLQPWCLCQLCNFDALLEWTSWYRAMLCQWWQMMQLNFTYRLFTVIFL